MNAEATTLYKLMVLYMLAKVNFPLTNSQISEFILDKQYTNYFTLQEVISSLVDDNFITVLTYRSSTQYKLTQNGNDTISFFQSKIPTAIREDIDKYLEEKEYDLKSEVGVTANYYRGTEGDYIAHCQVLEGNSTLIELSLSVPLEEQADAICSKWKDKSEEIYSAVIHKLL
jgi:predicted transcriptional regulator